MKFKTILYLLIAMSFTLLSSCEEMISDVDVEPVPAKLVVTGFIAPDLPFITIQVLKTQPLYTEYAYNQSLSVPDAKVSIMDNNETHNLIYNEDLKNYRLASTVFPIVAGKTYRIIVNAPGGFLASATCTVPTEIPPPITVVSVDDLVANFNFKDIDTPGHFYRLSATSLAITDTSFAYAEGYFDRGNPVVSDVNRDGDVFTFRTEPMYIWEAQATHIQLTIAVTDEHYYKYHKELLSYESDNPFAEPMPIYSNMNGALGIFGAYIQRELLVEIEQE